MRAFSLFVFFVLFLSLFAGFASARLSIRTDQVQPVGRFSFNGWARGTSEIVWKFKLDKADRKIPFKIIVSNVRFDSDTRGSFDLAVEFLSDDLIAGQQPRPKKLSKHIVVRLGNGSAGKYEIKDFLVNAGLIEDVKQYNLANPREKDRKAEVKEAFGPMYLIELRSALNGGEGGYYRDAGEKNWMIVSGFEYMLYLRLFANSKTNPSQIKAGRLTINDVFISGDIVLGGDCGVVDQTSASGELRIQMSGSPKQCVTSTFIDSVLKENGSPAQGTGASFIKWGNYLNPAIPADNIDAAAALAFFERESDYGTDPNWVGRARGAPDAQCGNSSYGSHSIGNIRYNSRINPAICSFNCRGYCGYATWDKGIYSWFRLIANSNSYMAGGKKTVDTIVPVFAPRVENDTALYINTVKKNVILWRMKRLAEIMAPPLRRTSENPVPEGEADGLTAFVANISGEDGLLHSAVNISIGRPSALNFARLSVSPDAEINLNDPDDFAAFGIALPAGEPRDGYGIALYDPQGKEVLRKQLELVSGAADSIGTDDGIAVPAEDVAVKVA
ncbi:MAG: hypothetical protein HY394_04445 [Candidatus Diapherotrites archaeon]|nr:hypothetical protein [Candidatus Diapherotrites archaeon]